MENNSFAKDDVSMEFIEELRKIIYMYTGRVSYRV